jgi:AcrR family transcriptional regulator
LDAAIKLFAERGFDAQTRELARRLGISEPLIYRYFPTKDDLIRCVFHEVIESRWDDDWARLLRDREVPLRARLVDFYQRYLDAIDDDVWIRIVMYASLDGLDMTRNYISDRVGDVMGIIAAETAAVVGAEREIDHEHLWQLQSTLIYYLVRKHIHRTPVAPDRAAVVAMAVDAFVDVSTAPTP